MSLKRPIRPAPQGQHQRMARLRPVEGLQIPAASRDALNRFWRAHPALRSGCLRKYGFDPIDDEEDYWRFGLAEPDHRDVLQAARRNGKRFSLALVRRWEAEELKDAKSGDGDRPEAALQRTRQLRPQR